MALPERLLRLLAAVLRRPVDRVRGARAGAGCRATCILSRASARARSRRYRSSATRGAVAFEDPEADDEDRDDYPRRYEQGEPAAQRLAGARGWRG